MHIEEIKKMPIEDFLISLGIKPDRSSQGGAILWYITPWRTEKDASLKVDTSQNLWVDFGEGKGGSVIDLAMRILNLDFHQACLHLAGDKVPRTWSAPIQERKTPVHQHDYREAIQSLTNLHLLCYGESRGIPDAILRAECQQMNYTATDGIRHHAIAFQSEKGWECRNEAQKRTFGKKGISVRGNRGNPSCVIMEGFFDYLSFITLDVLTSPSHRRKNHDYVILNGVGQVDDAIHYVDSHRYHKILLCLDNDEAGGAATRKMLSRLSGCGKTIVDCRSRYHPHNDLNDFLKYKIQEIKNLANMKTIIDMKIDNLFKECSNWAALYANTGNGQSWLRDKFHELAELMDISNNPDHRHIVAQKIVIDALHAIHGTDAEDFRCRCARLDAAIEEIAKDTESESKSKSLKR